MHTRWLFLILLNCCATLLQAQPAPDKKEQPAQGPVSYFRDIRPIFQDHCLGCHQPAKRGGDF